MENCLHGDRAKVKLNIDQQNGIGKLGRWMPITLVAPGLHIKSDYT